MLDIKKLKREIILNCNDSIFVFIRHGEKRDDGLLSINGFLSSIKFATQLKTLNQKIFLFTSPEPRCMETSKIISFTAGVEQPVVLDELGCPGIHIYNNIEYMNLYKQYKARYIYSQWKKGFLDDVFHTTSNLRKLFYVLMDNYCRHKGIYLFIGHSGTIATLGYALDKVIYDVDKGEWVEYLNGFCFFCSSNIKK